MIATALAETAAACGMPVDVDAVVTIAVPGGAVLAERTLNGRLGIKGGLSILGTTGVVVPFSCAAWLHSIHRGIDVARAARLTHVAAATGSVSEAAVRDLYGLPDLALIDMGDFAGGTLKYLRRHPLPRLTLAGGFGKLAKLADGELYLHSSKSRVDVPGLAERLRRLGAPPSLVEAAAAGGSAAQVLALARAAGLPLADAIAADARTIAGGLLSPETTVEVLIFDRAGRAIGRAG
jgi:cobalt-precorrin-5B (C1)-methyltransferase